MEHFAIILEPDWIAFGHSYDHVMTYSKHVCETLVTKDGVTLARCSIQALLWTFCLGTWLGDFGLGALPWQLWLGSCGFGTLAWELWGRKYGRAL